MSAASKKPPLSLQPAQIDAWQDARRSGSPAYVDPLSGFIVLTEDALIARGECCGNGCRHCPYDWKNVPESRARAITRRQAPPAG